MTSQIKILCMFYSPGIEITEFLLIAEGEKGDVLPKEKIRLKILMENIRLMA